MRRAGERPYASEPLGIEWHVETADEPVPSALTPEVALTRAIRRATWSAWCGGLAAFVALDQVVALTVPPEYQTLWRVLVVGFASFGAAGYFWMTVPAAARPARLLVWFTQVAYCGLYAVIELILAALVPGIATPVRVALVAATSAMTVTAFNRLTGRLVVREAAERAALERAHADALRLEGVVLAARTMQHRLNNALGVTSAYAELLAEDAALPPDARGRALVVLQSAQDAARQVSALGRVTRVEQDARFDVPVLDLERSIADEADSAQDETGAVSERHDERIVG